MAGSYIGIDGIARKIKCMYIGVGGVARKVLKVYVGVDGTAKLCWDGSASGNDEDASTSMEE